MEQTVELLEEYIRRSKEDHQYISESIHALKKAVKENKDSHQILVCFSLLIAYFTKHISFEESMMKDSLYPDLEEQKSHHIALLEELSAMRQRFIQKRNLNVNEVTHWNTDFESHMDFCDSKFFLFLLKKSESSQ